MQAAKRVDDNMISVGGTSKRSNSALVLTPIISQNFFDLTMKGILYKPHF